MTGKEEYIEFVNKNQQKVPIFLQPSWLDIVAEGRQWGVAVVKSKSSITGVWPYIIYPKYTMQFAMQPVLTPYLGPYLFYPPNQTKTESRLAFEKKTISKLIDQLPQKLKILKTKINPALTNWLPLYWRGYKQTTNYTYQINNTSEAQLKEGYTSSLRSELKNIPTSIIIEESDDAALVYQLSKESYKKQKSEIYYSEDTFTKIDDLLRSSNSRTIYTAKRANGDIIACVYIIYDREIAYLPIIGRGEIQSEESAITKSLIHHSILKSFEKGIQVYDFEGSMFSQFEKVFRSYGSHQVPYHVITRLNSKILEMLLG